MKNGLKTGGFMMIEVIIVASIIIVSVLAAMSVTEKAIFVSRQSLHILQSSFLLEEGAEVMRLERDNSWNNISSLDVNTTYYPVFNNGSWELATISVPLGIFTRAINIADVERDATTQDITNSGVVDAGTKLVTITVSWPEGGSILSKSLSFYLMDIF